MLIDWFTVGAQVLNFVILVGLLKHFLYKPILKAIDERQNLIATHVAEAETAKAEAQKEREDFAGRNAAFEEQRAAAWEKASADADAEGQRLLEEARKTAETLRVKRLEALQIDERNLAEALGQKVHAEVLTLSQKILTQLASAQLEEQMVAVFVRHLEDLPAADRLRLNTQSGLLRSAFELPGAQRTAIEQALPGMQLRYEVVPQLISGLDLSANGYKLAWNVPDQLAALP